MFRKKSEREVSKLERRINLLSTSDLHVYIDQYLTRLYAGTKQKEEPSEMSTIAECLHLLYKELSTR